MWVASAEHNATDLVITPPAIFAENEAVTSYIIAFATGGMIIHSEPFDKAETLSVPLWQQLTMQPVLGVQLEAYDNAGEFIGKSEYISGLRFLPSACGNDTPADTDNPDLISEFLRTKHAHSNLGVLDKLSEDENGTLLHDGEIIGSGGVYVGSGEMPEGYNVQIDPTGDASVPAYWQMAVDEAAEKVKALQNSIGSDAVNFVLFSDIHCQKSVLPYIKNVGALSAALMNECNIPLAIMAGDTARSGAAVNEAQLLAELGKANEIFAPIGNERLLQIRGNHDDVWGTSGAESYVNKVAPSKMYNLIHRKQACDFRRVFGGNGTYFYVDNIPQKTRFICLNSHYYDGEEITDGTANAMAYAFGKSQLEWLANKALPVDKEGWCIVIAVHVPPASDASIEDNAVFRGIVNAYCGQTSYSGEIAVDYSDAITAEITGVFSGHVHCDSVVKNDLPCPIVTITCAAPLSYDGTEADRTAGTATETALDVVTIDNKNKKIYLTRLGIGSDRVCSYEKTGYTNQLDTAGYVEGYRISSSTGDVQENAATDLTGFIPCKRGDIIRLKDITFPVSTANVGVHFYAADKSTKNYSFIANAWTMSAFGAVTDGTNLIQFTLPSAEEWSNPGDFAYIRICASDINADSIITVNEVI